MDEPVLSVTNLRTLLFGEAGVSEVVRGATFAVHTRQTVGIVGESGCGKTMLAQSVLGAIAPLPGVVAGSVVLHTNQGPRELLAGIDKYFPTALLNRPLTISRWRAGRWKRRHHRLVRPFRGRIMAYLHQNSSLALNPLWKVRRIIGESLERSQPTMTRAQRYARGAELLEQLAIRQPEQVLQLYPHELSMGMAKRVALAQVLALEPMLLVVDEPTTGLDLTVQAEVMELLRSVQKRTTMAMIFISHEINLLSRVADSIIVIREGQIVDQGAWEHFFGDSPSTHEYTCQLLQGS